MPANTSINLPCDHMPSPACFPHWGKTIWSPHGMEMEGASRRWDWMGGEEAEVRSAGSGQRLCPRRCQWQRVPVLCLPSQGSDPDPFVNLVCFSSICYFLAAFCAYFVCVCALFLSASKTDLWVLCYLQSYPLAWRWLSQTLGWPVIAVAMYQQNG